MAQYKIEKLNFTYPDKEKKALNNLSFEIQQGEFLCVCGKSGCGKSTLLRHLKPTLTPHGLRVGDIYFMGEKLERVSDKNQAQKIGYVLQNPDNQIVTDKVWHELAFGLESLGYDTKTIRLRVAEMANFFGIEKWFMKNVNELSGGQKQLLNLASIMAMQPDVLILDEPTAQLDPIAASEFLHTVTRINRELGTTVIITEHRLEEVFPIADRVLVLDNGEIIMHDNPYKVGENLKKINHDMFLSMPTALQIFAGVNSDLTCPLTVREGRQWLSNISKGKDIISRKIEKNEEFNSTEKALTLKDVWFRYSRDGKDIVSGVSMELYKGEIFCIMGGNGTGKTTTLSLISTILKPYRGKININDSDNSKVKKEELFNELLGVLPQNPQSIFVKKTVKEDLELMVKNKKISKEEKEKMVYDVAKKVEIETLLDSHPYDLSGGEQQRASLAKVLLLNPKILLLDEPTKGMDSCFKHKFGEILKKLQKDGVSILIVSHDVEFCAVYANRCALFFNGNIVAQGSTRTFFSGNSFYTTSANRMSRHLFENAVLVKEVIKLCLENKLQQ